MHQPSDHRPGVSASEPYPLERLFGRVLSPLERFLRQATAGGIVLVATTALTLGIANSPWGEPFAHLWEQRAGLRIGPWALEQSLHHWTNDDGAFLPSRWPGAQARSARR